MKQKKNSQAFTLIELLTVIAIIGILASILIPTVSKVRDTARQAVCSSNVRQLALAMVNYAMDKDGILPAAGSRGQDPNRPDDWIFWQAARDVRDSAIAPYVGDNVNEALFQCPSDTQTAERAARGWYQFSYSMNGRLARNEAFGNYNPLKGRIDRVRNPTRVILLAEEANPDDGHWAAPGNQLTNRHGGRANVAFADAHVRLMEQSEMARNPEFYDPLY